MADMNPQKKKWSSPKLTILTRDNAAQVLEFCKSGMGLSVRPHGPGWGGCMYARGWRDCQADCCTGDYVIKLQNPCSWPDYYRGCLCGCHVTQAS